MKQICGRCGTELVYSAEKHKMVCPKCGAEYEPEADAVWFDEYGVMHPL